MLWQAVIFVDNSGADIILGIMPFARELLRRGTQVCTLHHKNGFFYVRHICVIIEGHVLFFYDLFQRKVYAFSTLDFGTYQIEGEGGVKQYLLSLFYPSPFKKDDQIMY